MVDLEGVLRTLLGRLRILLVKLFDLLFAEEMSLAHVDLLESQRLAYLLILTLPRVPHLLHLRLVVALPPLLVCLFLSPHLLLVRLTSRVRIFRPDTLLLVLHLDLIVRLGLLGMRALLDHLLLRRNRLYRLLALTPLLA